MVIATSVSQNLPPEKRAGTLHEQNQRFHAFTVATIWHTLRIPLLVLLLIAVCECSFGNIPFWTSVTGSTDSVAAHNTLGPGVVRLSSGGLLITDPSEAYLEVTSDGSSPYIRLQPATLSHKVSRKTTAIRKQAVKHKTLIDDIHVRIEADRTVGKPQSTNPRAFDAALLTLPESAIHKPCIVRIWLQHPLGTVLDIEDARANVRAPFSWSWGRVCLLALCAFLIGLWNPWSRLWRIQLDTHSLKQRCFFVASLLPLVIVGIVTVVWNLKNSTPLHFDTAGNYTYDFDQYAHTADALLKGQVHLNLPVPRELTQLANPYDPMARNMLLNHSVHNMYWDYAYYQGHWYSYFGVLPAVLLFMPYRLISGLWIPGGAMLPTTVATIVFLIGFLIAGSLLVIRLIKHTVDHASLGTVSIAVVMFFITANTVYLWFRTSFYSVPMAASLFFTALGLCCYCGYNKTKKLRNIALGSFFISLNLGCRPTFIIAILFAIPAFYTDVKNSIIRFRNSFHGSYDSRSWLTSLTYLVCWILPVILVAIPFCCYNMLRFGSPMNFGNEYQITITDMTTMRLPAQNILPSIISYVALPLRIIGTFPWIGIQPLAFDRWQYAEPMIGGMFVLSPLALVGIIAAFLMRKRSSSNFAWHTVITALVAGSILIVFDSLKAGVGWRYIADFAWTFALAAVVGVTLLLEHLLSMRQEDCLRKKVAYYSLTSVVVALLAFSLIIAALSWFVTGREDSTLRFNPDLWYTVRAWLTLM